MLKREQLNDTEKKLRLAKKTISIKNLPEIENQIFSEKLFGLFDITPK